jgi:hypothetical protein
MMGRVLRTVTIALIVGLLLFAISAGKYAGRWEGASGASGDFRLTLLPASDGKWNADVVFAFGGQDVKCKVKSVNVDGDQIAVVYTFDLQGFELESAIEGKASGDRLAGTYKTRALADGSVIDEGTWQTSATH